VNVGTGGQAADQTTLFALFPHQQANMQQVLGTTDASVFSSNQKYTGSKGLATSQTERGNPNFSDGLYNGQMRLAQGTGFVLQYTLPPLYDPVLPLASLKGDQARLKQCLDWDWNIAWGIGRVSGHDSYGWGKLLGSVANNYQIAQALNYDGAGGKTHLAQYLGDGLKQWLNVSTPSTTDDPTLTYFAYDPNWNQMFPFPPGVSADGFGVVIFLNDMHFHYGYFIRAAAVYAKYNPSFITQYGKIVEHLIRSIAADYNDQPNGAPDDAVYPPYRFFDPYAGSSSASGAQQYGDGMNQESSSEAVNAWYGMLLWAKVTNNATMLARAAYMYASETDVARRYVFCEDAVTSGQFALASNTFSNLYDDSNQLTLFFTATPGIFAREPQHVINWLPFGGGALYLNVNKPYAGLNYTALVNQPPGGDTFTTYSDLIWMYRAISNPAEAQTKANDINTYCIAHSASDGKLDNGNSLSMLYQWVFTLPYLGFAQPQPQGKIIGILYLLLQD
jgi:endoglucanase Acf2